MKLRSIQMLRGIAALGVVICHGMRWLPGAAGVDLFFVISGFIIATVMPGRSAGEFLAARLWRIFPMLWICTLPWIALAYATSGVNTDRLISSVTLWPIGLGWPYLRPAWSLCYEMLFYYAVTLAILTGGGRWIIGGFLAALVANLAYPSPLLGFFGYPLIFNFLMGFGLTRAPRYERWGALSLLVAVVALAFAPPTAAHQIFGTSDWSTVLRAIQVGVPCALIVYGALSLERFATWKPLILLGDASYSIYLTHLGIVVIFPGAVGVICAIGLGLIVHRYVEKPLLHQSRKAQPPYERGYALAGTVKPLSEL